MKTAFTLIEVLTATMIMGIVMVVSLQSVGYVNQIHQQNELRYLALNRLDSEMSRLVMAYENYASSDNFVDNTYANTSNIVNWQEDFNLTKNLGTSDIYRIYKYDNNKNAIKNDSYGLKLHSGNDRNWVQLKNIDGGVNENDKDEVDNNDFVALIGWKISLDSITKEANLSLNITYPYIYHTDTDFPQLWNFTETINLKTSTKVN